MRVQLKRKGLGKDHAENRKQNSESDAPACPSGSSRSAESDLQRSTWPSLCCLLSPAARSCVISFLQLTEIVRTLSVQNLCSYTLMVLIIPSLFVPLQEAAALRPLLRLSFSFQLFASGSSPTLSCFHQVY